MLSSTTVRQRISQGVTETEHYKTKAEATSMGLRMALWSNTIELIKERPILGYGSGSFEKAYSAKIANDPAWEKTITHDPHNQFLRCYRSHSFFEYYNIRFFAKTFISFLYIRLGRADCMVWKQLI